MKRSVAVTLIVLAVLVAAGASAAVLWWRAGLPVPLPIKPPAPTAGKAAPTTSGGPAAAALAAGLAAPAPPVHRYSAEQARGLVGVIDAWGFPDGEMLMPTAADLPNYAGWQNYLGAGGWMLSAWDSRFLIVTQFDAVRCVDTRSGRTAWERTGDSGSYGQTFQLIGGNLIAWIKGNVVCLKAADGTQRWEYSADTIAGGDEAGVWLLGAMDQAGDETKFNELSLISLADGSRLAHYYPQGVVNYSTPLQLGAAGGYALTPMPVCAVQTAGEIQAYSREKLLWSRPFTAKTHAVQLVMTPRGLLLADYVDAGKTPWPAESLEKVAELPPAQYKAFEKKHEKEFAKPTPLRVELIEPESGRTLWKLDLKSNDSSGYFPPPVLPAGDYFGVYESAWSGSGQSAVDAVDCDVYRLASGEKVGNLGDWHKGPVLDLMGATPEGLFIAPLSREDQPGGLVLIDPAAKRSTTLKLSGGLALPRPALMADVLYYCTNLGPADRFGKTPEALIAARLTPEHQVVAGVPARIGLPVYGDALARRFLAAPEPLKNKKLMADIAAGGATPLKQLLKQGGSLKPAQLDALLSLCRDQDKAHEDVTERYNYVDRFFYILARRVPPGLLPRLIAWWRDESLADNRAVIIGTIVVNGGPQARAFLASAYPDLAWQWHRPAPPPYDVTADANRWDEPQWSAVTAPDGTEYMAYDFDMPGADILLRTGRVDDRMSEKVYLTGLHNIFSRNFGMSRDGLEQPKGPLKLTLSGDSLTIWHHRPVWRRGWLFGRLLGKHEILAGADYVKSTVSLAAIKLDSDKDGLTDILEEHLLLDKLNPDTDGDGVIDGQDRLPNCDPARTGVVERGASRALYYDNVIAQRKAGFEGISSAFITEAQYLDCKGLGPVPASGDGYGTVVSMYTPELKKRFEDVCAGGWPPGEIRLTLLRLDGEGRRIYDDPEEAETDGAAERAKRYDGDCIIRIDYHGAGSEILLKYVEGELYPVGNVGGWIS